MVKNYIEMIVDPKSKAEEPYIALPSSEDLVCHEKNGEIEINQRRRQSKNARHTYRITASEYTQNVFGRRVGQTAARRARARACRRGAGRLLFAPVARAF